MTLEETAIIIVDLILDDLRSRNGLENAWEEIDTEIRQEIRNEWIKLTIQAL